MIRDSRSHIIMLSTVFIALALSLWFQTGRFERGAAYANLLQIFGPLVWACLYLVAGILTLASLKFRHSRTLITLTHTLNIVLVGSWWVGFVVRWFTDSATTVVNVLSWGVFLYVALQTAVEVDRESEAVGER
jgi:hypothetical protein